MTNLDFNFMVKKSRLDSSVIYHVPESYGTFPLAQMCSKQILPQVSFLKVHVFQPSQTLWCGSRCVSNQHLPFLCFRSTSFNKLQLKSPWCLILSVNTVRGLLRTTFQRVESNCRQEVWSETTLLPSLQLWLTAATARQAQSGVVYYF